MMGVGKSMIIPYERRTLPINKQAPLVRSWNDPIHKVTIIPGRALDIASIDENTPAERISPGQHHS
jgi:hypothetical protein